MILIYKFSLHQSIYHLTFLSGIFSVLLPIIVVWLAVRLITGSRLLAFSISEAQSIMGGKKMDKELTFFFLSPFTSPIFEKNGSPGQTNYQHFHPNTGPSSWGGMRPPLSHFCHACRASSSSLMLRGRVCYPAPAEVFFFNPWPFVSVKKSITVSDHLIISGDDRTRRCTDISLSLHTHYYTATYFVYDNICVVCRAHALINTWYLVQWPPGSTPNPVTILLHPLIIPFLPQAASLAGGKNWQRKWKVCGGGVEWSRVEGERVEG